MSSSINPLTGANPALTGDPASAARPKPPEPATIQSAVAQPLTTPQTAVTQSPKSGNAEWQRKTNPDGRQQTLPERKTTDREQLKETLDRLNQSLSRYNTALHFEIDDQYQEMVVRVVDVETQEVVRQIPPEKALALAQFFDELEQTQQVQNAPATEDSSSGKDNGRLPEGWLFRATA